MLIICYSISIAAVYSYLNCGCHCETNRSKKCWSEINHSEIWYCWHNFHNHHPYSWVDVSKFSRSTSQILTWDNTLSYNDMQSVEFGNNWVGLCWASGPWLRWTPGCISTSSNSIQKGVKIKVPRNDTDHHEQIHVHCLWNYLYEGVNGVNIKS